MLIIKTQMTNYKVTYIQFFLGGMASGIFKEVFESSDVVPYDYWQHLWSISDHVRERKKKTNQPQNLANLLWK